MGRNDKNEQVCSEGYGSPSVIYLVNDSLLQDSVAGLEHTNVGTDVTKQ